MKRYLPDRPFPEYIFVPGENPHPKKSGGHMEGENDPVVDPLDINNPSESKTLRYSLDLYNHGYYWESHVYFEALWNAHHRQGPIADLLKGMIKLGAAGVKKNIGQLESAQGHRERALEIFREVMGQEGDHFLGFNLRKLCDDLQSSADLPMVHPLWE